METLKIGYYNVFGTNFVHTYILYEPNSDNAIYSEAQIARGGPEGDLEIDRGSNFPLNQIKTETGNYTESADYDNDGSHRFIELKSDEDLSDDFAKIKEAMDALDASETNYYPARQNLNSAVGLALEHAGISLPSLPSGVIAPGLDTPTLGLGDLAPWLPGGENYPLEPPNEGDEPDGDSGSGWSGPSSPNRGQLSSPLVVDLDGDGIELTTPAWSRTYFDLDNDGFAERTGWVASDDAIAADPPSSIEDGRFGLPMSRLPGEESRGMAESRG